MAPKKLNVIYLIGSLEIGGAEMLALDICSNRQLLQDCELTLMYRKTGRLFEAFEKTGVKMQQMKASHSAASIIELRRYLRTHKCDVVHVHQAIDAVRYNIACLFSGTKLVCTHHGYTRGNFAKRLIQWAYNSANLNVFVSRHCFNLYQQHTQRIPKNYQIVLNGIALDRLKSVSRFRQSLHLQKDQMVFCMTGNFYIDARDQYLVCEALAQVLPKLADLQFVFIGGWSAEMHAYVQSCKDLISQNNLSDRVHFVGTIPNAGAALQEVDAFVYLSHYETFGIGLAEAVLLGKPCIINDYPALTEVCQDAVMVTTVPSGDTDRLAKAIFELANQLKQSNKSVKPNSESPLLIQHHIRTLSAIYQSI